MKSNKTSTLGTFWRLIKTYGSQHLLVIAILLTAALAGLEITTSYLLKRLLDTALNGEFSYFGRVLWILCAITVVMMAARYYRNQFAGDYTERGIRRMRQIFADDLLHLPGGDLEKHHSGDLISRMTNDMNQIREFSTYSLLEVIYEPLAAIGAFFYLLTLNWQLTLISTIVVPVIFHLSSKLSDPVAKYTKQLQERLAVVNKETQESLSGIEVVRAYGMEPIVSERYNDAVDRTVDSAILVSIRRAILTGVSHFVYILPQFICFGFGGYWVVKGAMSAGSLIAFITLLNPLTLPISKMPTLFGDVKGQMVAAGRLFEILDLQKERETGTNLPIVNDAPIVEFRDVTFAYPEGEVVLHGVNFSVKPGEKVALVGQSGSGKTTIFNLILGYFETYLGKIEIFGHPMQEWNLQKMRDRLSIIAQDTYLFPGTIAENIGLGKVSATPQEIAAAAEAANAHSFISELKDGYLTNVGEYGANLSGGQRQRIAIARAMVRNANLYLLDEATSALDSQSEMQVQKALDHLLNQGHTFIIISHRLSTIQRADRILVLDKGRIVETGTHEELLAKNGVYRSMCARQFQQESVVEAKEAAV